MKKLFRFSFVVMTLATLVMMTPTTQAGDDIYGDQLPAATNWVGDPGGTNSPKFSMDFNGNLVWATRTHSWNPATDRYEALSAQGKILWWLIDHNQPGSTDDHFVYGQENPDGTEQEVIGSGTLGQTP